MKNKFFLVLALFFYSIYSYADCQSLASNADDAERYAKKAQNASDLDSCTFYARKAKNAASDAYSAASTCN